MAGICPNCIRLVAEGEVCPQCRGPLISVGQWNREKDLFLAPRAEPPESSLIADPAPSIPQAEPPIRFYGLRVFLGAVSSLIAFLVVLGLVYHFQG